VPFPFLFYRYGEQIRMKCKYAAQAARALDEMRDTGNTTEEEEDETEEREVGSKRGLGDGADIENGSAADLGGEAPVDNQAPHRSSKEGC
jgi:hypothetical protein